MLRIEYLFLHTLNISLHNRKKTITYPQPEGWLHLCEKAREWQQYIKSFYMTQNKKCQVLCLPTNPKSNKHNMTWPAISQVQIKCDFQIKKICFTK